ncbi:type I-B CRISPR-associated endonuclease Cas1b [Caloramator sp. ALD01]|uniref:type I-B CRISPR-associated endonuclease Cas1b n=1 Tax=Caloramator sp. ALD01 TaxID=1031288 RepID=UPI0004177ED4|nr:type I-B CRISPR-associated endonuclease Cas1b [Caloramator sp. ALD01]
MKRNYYIMNSGRLKRKDNTLYFENEQGSKAIPVNDVESVLIYGEVDINTKALNFLSQNNIMAHIFNYYGYYSGTFYPREKYNSGYLIIQQAKHNIDNEKRCYIAREILYSASYNIVKNIKHYEDKDIKLKEIIEKIEKLRQNLLTAFDIPTIMGIEGNIRQLYYESIPIIISERFEFKERVKRPPNNPMNALISFGNSVMYTTVLGEIYNTQLNPTISYLHQPGERRFSLALDIAEIFKPIIVDRVIFKLINEGIIKESDFLKELEYCYLNDEGRKKFLREYENKLSSTIHHKKLDREVSYRTLIRLELYKLIKHLIEEDKYEGFKMWW